MKNVARFLALVSLSLACLALPGRAKEGDYTLIVAPARFNVIQVAFDLIAKRPAVLMSYRGEATTAEPLIYAWNGKQWVYVSMQDYREMRFLEDSPKNVVLLGDEATLPAALQEATTWTKNKKTVAALDNAALVNEFGRLFKWDNKEWDWFASRYNLRVQDESEPYRHSSWYDQKGPFRKSTYKQVAPPSFTPSATPTAPVTNVAPAAPDMPPAPVTGTSSIVIPVSGSAAPAAIEPVTPTAPVVIDHAAKPPPTTLPESKPAEPVKPATP